MTKRAFTPAFTLVELMISIALVVILMAGVAQVFSLTSKTANATQGVSTQLRDSRAAQTVFYNDLQNIATDGPFMLLRSRAYYAFNTKNDELTDADHISGLTGVTTIDVDGNNVEGESVVPGEVVTPSTYNYRNHRLDMLSFFARGRFDRQTGNYPGVIIADESENEAWLWYGHLNIINNGASGSPAFAPGDTSTSFIDNRYASQFILGRVATLLREPQGTLIYDRSTPPITQDYVQAAAGDPLSPLSRASKTSGVAGTFIYQSWNDLAGTSISGFRQTLINYLTANVGVHWWANLMLGDDPDATTLGFNIGSGRFQCDPRPQKPLQDYKMYQQVPNFLQNCTQFIVEFAGDFVAQDTNPLSPTYGQVTNAYYTIDTGIPPTPPATDGQIDFIVKWDDINNNGQIEAIEQPTIRREIRWYGLPRDLNHDGTIAGGTGTRTNNDLVDVVPLRDVIRSAANSTALSMPPALKNYIMSNLPQIQAPFERSSTNVNPSPPVIRDNYALPNASLSSTAATDGMGSNEMYTCAWGPSDTVRPKMIRILAYLNAAGIDHDDGQRFEWIIKLP